MEDNTNDSLAILQELDDSTDWVLPEELEELEQSCASCEECSCGCEVFDPDTSVEDIIDSLSGMNEAGEVESVVVIMNSPESDQLLLTNIGRNDLIIGCLATAQMNWHSSQLEAQSYQEGEEEETV